MLAARVDAQRGGADRHIDLVLVAETSFLATHDKRVAVLYLRTVTDKVRAAGRNRRHHQRQNGDGSEKDSQELTHRNASDPNVGRTTTRPRPLIANVLDSMRHLLPDGPAEIGSSSP
jgi:hypothetical protein